MTSAGNNIGLRVPHIQGKYKSIAHTLSIWATGPTNILLYIIIPQVSFSQSVCGICGQYDVILPFLTKKYDSDALFVLECKQTT